MRAFRLDSRSAVAVTGVVSSAAAVPAFAFLFYFYSES